ncbi:MAG: V-type ATPase subunit [Candidatus Bipolaricaulota bacterium]|nr:V-type ATPase subunit [Candidatus Bipolaricaulota bacterium]MCS7274353.1 V-type ATPase subunit [Candidatus Bipolaricaulota bacterium]MDW8110483.1 V-type ATPase subunit [Candidatus Bipolaricaulota bacterium]MDW8329164.1 V-type ATPase subunit [Candidatus Bipolaricaulota bacterium]
MSLALLETSFRQDGAYAFATGQIRALEAKLLDGAKYQRLLDAPDAIEAWRALAEVGYTKATEVRLDHYEQALQSELRELYDLVRRLTVRPRETDWLAQRYDFHHLKVYLKAKLLGEEPGEGVVPGVGLVPPKLIETAVQTEIWSALPEALAHAGERAFREYQTTKQAQTLDVVLDTELFALIQREVSGHPYLETLVALWTDLLNLKTLLRAKLLHRERGFVERALLPAGMLEKSKLLKLFESAVETWAEELRHTEYGELIGRSLRAWEEQQSLALLEKLSDDLVVNYLKRAKLALYGVEPLVAYALAKEIELKNIRMILIGKLNGLSKEAIAERLRVSYV